MARVVFAGVNNKKKQRCNEWVKSFFKLGLSFHWLALETGVRLRALCFGSKSQGSVVREVCHVVGLSLRVQQGVDFELLPKMGAGEAYLHSELCGNLTARLQKIARLKT